MRYETYAVEESGVNSFAFISVYWNRKSVALVGISESRTILYDSPCRSINNSLPILRLILRSPGMSVSWVIGYSNRNLFWIQFCLGARLIPKFNFSSSFLQNLELLIVKFHICNLICECKKFVSSLVGSFRQETWTRQICMDQRVRISKGATKYTLSVDIFLLATHYI